MHTAVAAIIPAHNEEKTIAAVVGAARASGFFREVIVVSDGSSDKTAQVAREAGATLVHELPSNRGKGFALSHGVMHTDASIVCFLDADLQGLTPHHIEGVLAPVLNGERYMNIGLCDRGALVNTIARYLPWVSGQRALHREVFDSIPSKFMSGFGVEIALNYFCSANGLPFGLQPLLGLRLTTKFGKVGVLRALPQYLRMWWQVAYAALRVRLARRQFKEHGTHMSHHHR